MHRGAYMRGMPGTMGPSACLELGGVRVIVNTFPSQIHDREQLKLFGIEAEAMNVIASKAFNHMRADFEPISRGLLYPDSGGIFSFDFARFPYAKVRRPIWPLDRFDIAPGAMDRC
jgi:microcystin degradation protein MlrC